MHRDPVKSSQILALGYDPAAQLLEVEFKTGGVYQYLNVPEFVATELRFSDSVGSYFGANIRGAYKTLRVLSTGDSVPLESRPCTEKQAGYLLGLMHNAGLCTEAGAEHVHPGMAPLFRDVLGGAEPVLRAAPAVRVWVASLTSEQASKGISWMKEHGGEL